MPCEVLSADLVERMMSSADVRPQLVASTNTSVLLDDRVAELTRREKKPRDQTLELVDQWHELMIILTDLDCRLSAEEPAVVARAA